MNSDDLPVDRIEDEASLWAARLRSGAMADADRTQLEAWLAESEQHRAVLARYRELTATLDVGFTRRSKRVTMNRRWWRIAGAATALAAAAAIVIGVFATGRDTITTGIGERRVVALADGSRVELNARTELFVDLSRRERRVRLAQGEALFTVAKDAARPFVVDAPGGLIQVTGTVFDVRAANATSAEVTVLEGHVRLQPRVVKPTPAVLEANTQGIVGGGHVIVRPLSHATAREAIAWREGQVVFQDTPLADALTRFAAYDARQIEVSPGAADLRLGGRYSLNDLDGALDSIERMLPVRIVHRGDVVRIEVR